MSVGEVQDPELVKLTVNLTTRAHVALVESAESCGHTQTDTVNRALVLYAMLVEVALSGKGTGQVQFDLNEESRAVLAVVRARKREIAPSA